MIYFLDEDPTLSGKYLADKHISINLVNTCTAICTILHSFGIEIPQKTYKNNILVNWGSMTRGNFVWLVEYAKSLSDDFEEKFGKRHQTSIDLYSVPIPESLVKLKVTEFPQLLPDRYKRDDSSVEAYRNYYVSEKAKVSDFKKEAPSWFLDKLNEAQRTLYLDYFEELGCSVRIYRDKKLGIVIQKQEEDNWINLSNLLSEEKILLERVLENVNYRN